MSPHAAPLVVPPTFASFRSHRVITRTMAGRRRSAVQRVRQRHLRSNSKTERTSSAIAATVGFHLGPCHAGCFSQLVMEAVEIVARRVLVAASVVLEPYTSVGAALIAHSVVGFSGSQRGVTGCSHTGHSTNTRRSPLTSYVIRMTPPRRSPSQNGQ